MVRDTICRARALVAQGKFSKAGLAAAAGLHVNSLRQMDSEAWNPMASTLLALEAFLDALPADQAPTAPAAVASPDKSRADIPQERAA